MRRAPFVTGRGCDLESPNAKPEYRGTSNRQAHQFERASQPELKPAHILWAFVARLKPCPFYKATSNEFFRDL
jgi:hypothetical protein